MNEYLLIAKGQRKTWDSMNDQDWEPVMQGFEAWIKRMKEKDLWIRGDRLTEKRIDVRKATNRLEVIDGPFAETKEVMTGFFLFRAENMDHAIELSKACPSLLHDSVELHEIEGDK